MTLDQVLDERIFEPLGMDRSFYLSSNKSERIAEPNFGAMAGPGNALREAADSIGLCEKMLLRGGEYRGAALNKARWISCVKNESAR